METHQQLLKILEALNRVSRGLRRSQDSPDSDLSAIKALDELRTASGLILSGDPLLVSLSQHLSSWLIRSHEVSRLAAEIESELDALIDRENVSNLTKKLAGMRCNAEASVVSSEEDQLFDQMSVLQERLSRGFDINLQDLLLKSGIFTELEWVLCNPLFSERVREKAAISMKELVLFNKDVFVGSVLIGGSVKALISMGSFCVPCKSSHR
ncbi:UNVERIFIED_CONTAM: hypothetical protein Sradi_4367800 [Sesamum radiatum]|uniref:Uncharacterized protein n=1 Tax=Sesamum radiatum TaxID=300843 RepID=A0AAW2NPC0_SESRA